MVVFALSPVPPALSLAVPLKVAGTVLGPKLLPFVGAVTDAVLGAVLSTVNVAVRSLNALPSLANTVWEPAEAPAGTLN